VGVTKDNLHIQLGIWGCVALKGFCLLGFEIMYFFLLYETIPSRIHGLHCHSQGWDVNDHG
jgi:hypothetical protein